MKSTIDKIEQVLTKALIHPDRVPKLIGEALELLREFREIEPSNAKNSGSKQRNKPTSYSIRETAKGECLVENRVDGYHPFLCERAVYDRVAAVLNGEKQMLDFTEIKARVTEGLVQAPAEYLLRVCIRFWLRSDPTLIIRSGGRYQVVKPENFSKQAAKLWDDLKLGEFTARKNSAPN